MKSLFFLLSLFGYGASFKLITCCQSWLISRVKVVKSDLRGGGKCIDYGWFVVESLSRRNFVVFPALFSICDFHSSSFALSFLNVSLSALESQSFLRLHSLKPQCKLTCFRFLAVFPTLSLPLLVSMHYVHSIKNSFAVSRWLRSWPCPSWNCFDFPCSLRLFPLSGIAVSVSVFTLTESAFTSFHGFPAKCVFLSAQVYSSFGFFLDTFVSTFAICFEFCNFELIPAPFVHYALPVAL